VRLRPIDRMVLIVVAAVLCAGFLVAATGVAAAAIIH